MPHSAHSRLSRRTALGFLAIAAPFSAGCAAPWFRSETPEEEGRRHREEIRGVLQSETRPRLLSEIGYSRGVTIGEVQNVGLVHGLSGTGGVVKPSPPRDRMLEIMRQNEAANPNTVLDDKNTAMVLATAHVPPAARKGTAMDVVVAISSHSEATDLENGLLFDTPLVQMSKLGGQLREGFKAASAAGQVVTIAQATGSTDPKDKLRGSVVGGARFSNQRELGISIEEEFADALTMAAILPAINERFTVFDGRSHVGAATPASSSRLELIVPKRYELDPYHFINVVLNLGIIETAAEKLTRLELLKKQVVEPVTCQRACWQLEAIGESTVETLAIGLGSTDPLVRFHTAHALAYLDDPRCIEPLKELSISEPAFRAMALNALSTIQHFEADDALRELLHDSSPEVRYGAVRGLRYRDPRDPQVKATQVGTTGKLLEIPSEGPPLVAVSLTKVPEVVIFGATPALNLPEYVYVNKYLLIRSEGNGMFTVSNFVPSQQDRSAQTAADLRSLLLAISEVGGSYGDWVKFIRESSQDGLLAEPIALNPVPTAGRAYHQEANSGLEPGEVEMSGTIINSVSSDEAAKQASSERSLLNPFSWWND